MSTLAPAKIGMETVKRWKAKARTIGHGALYMTAVLDASGLLKFPVRFKVEKSFWAGKPQSRTYSGTFPDKIGVEFCKALINRRDCTITLAVTFRDGNIQRYAISDEDAPHTEAGSDADSKQ
jgi:hypothetical protein